MISSHAETVTELLARYGQFRDDKNLSDKLRNRASELEEAVSRLEQPAKQVALQREREWLDGSQLPTADVEKLQPVIAKIRELLTDDPASINASVNRLVKGCDKVADKTAVSVKAAWDEVVKRRQPVVDEAELKRCEQFNSEAATISEIRRLKGISVARVPSDRDSLHEIETRWERMRELISSLPKGSENPEVNRFLDAVRKGGAPLELLTDSVRQYLDEQGKTDAFRIYQDR